MARSPRWVGDLLLSCATADDETARARRAALLDRHDLAVVAVAAAEHHVQSCVYRRLRELPAAAPVVAALGATYRANRRHQLRLEADLHALSATLDELGTPWMVVKGPYLAKLAYREHDLRDYLDLDLVVARADFPRVVQKLRDGGCTVVRRDWGLATRQLAGEVDLVTPAGTPLDVHWELLYHHHLRQRFTLTTEQMLTRTRRVQLGASTVPVPDPADALVHLAVHAFREGGVRLQWLMDIDQVVRHDPPGDWDDVVRCARQSSVSRVTGALLWRTTRLLGTPVPSDVLRALLPQPWRWALAGVDRLSPPHRSVGHRSVSSLVTRSIGTSGTATAANTLLAAREAASGLLPANRRTPTRPRDTVLREDDPRNSDVELDRFLDSVAASSRA